MDFKKLKKYLIPAFVVFVVITLYNMIFHGILMENIYLDNSHLFRPQDEIQKSKFFMWLANLFYSVAFCYIYSKGHEKTEAVAQGIRYGLWITLMIWIPQALVNYTIYPHPRSLELALLAGYTIQTLLAGITAAAVFPKIRG